MAGAITAVAVTSPGTSVFVDYPGYGFPVASVTDSTGTGAILTAERDPDGTGNPGVTTYHDGRQWFAASIRQPQTMWGSVAGNFNNMNSSQPTRDSDAIVRTIASRQVNEIRHMISLSNGMIVLTSGAEWKISAGQADVITPAQFVARPQSYNGSSYIRPIVVNDTLLYIPPNKKKVRSLQYQWAQDTGRHRPQPAGRPPVRAEQHHRLGLCARPRLDLLDGAQRRRGAGLHLPERAAGLCVVAPDHHQRHLRERLLGAGRQRDGGVFHRAPHHRRGDPALCRAHAHAGVRDHRGGVVPGLCAAVRRRGGDTISGLWHLVGDLVWALADGVVRGPFIVSTTGQITLPVAASLVTVGKIIPDADLELARYRRPGPGRDVDRSEEENQPVTVALKNSANTGMVAAPSAGRARRRSMR
jgi:hypothetical protein